MKKMFNEGYQIHNFMSSSGTVTNYGSGSGSGSTSLVFRIRNCFVMDGSGSRIRLISRGVDKVFPFLNHRVV